MYEYDPTPEECDAAEERERRRRERNGSSVFKKNVSKEEMKRCRCGACPEGGREEYEYCCMALDEFALNLKANGEKFYASLVQKVNGESVRCVTECSWFKKLLGAEGLSGAADMYDFIMGEKGSCNEGDNARFRFAAYRLLIFRTMGRMRSGERLQLPSCVEEAIRQKWPSEYYTGYREGIYYADEDR